MSVLGSNILAGASGQGGGDNLTRSLRFRSSSPSFLNRTFATGNLRLWTWSAWVKRGALGAANSTVFDTNSSVGGAIRGGVKFQNDSLFLNQNPTGSSQTTELKTTQVLRDPSAWYHIMVVWDTAQATASNRIKFYINGVLVTSFATATYPAQNTDSALNANTVHKLGTDGVNTSGESFDGYLTEVNFVDGQALTPSSFGEYSATTGVWQPKKYAGTYGTNGFYLPFTNTASTSTLGNDFSGNGNNWTTNNISLTSGATYDSMTDVPTLTSATASNYPVFNNLKRYSANLTVSNANLTATETTATISMTSVTMSFGISGKYYFECDMTSAGGSTSFFGVSNAANIFSNSITANSGSYRSSGAIYDLSGARPGDGNSYVTGDVIGVAVDVTAGTVQFYKNNVAQGNTPSFTFTAGTELWAFVACDNEAGTKTFNINFGQRPFAYTPPTGFVALNTFNLPTPSIGATASTQANKYFDATTWTGDGTSSRNITSLNFQPDFVWSKRRSSAASHVLFDIVRGFGSNKELQTDSTGSEGSGDTANFGYISAANSNGFTMIRGAVDSGYLNNTGNTHLAWNWKANGTGVTNTAGSITSTVSANTSAGFSVVTFTGNGSNPATVGHGLGVAPKFIIFKRRNSAVNWFVYAGAVGNGCLEGLNTTSAYNAGSAIFNSTAPTSTVFSLGNTDGNASGGTYVAYCFSEVAGYSKFGSYTGNGSTDGTFVFTGFRPRFVMIKRADSTSSWAIFDTSRNTFNVTDNNLFANLSDAESTFTVLDILSNGFKIRTTLAGSNASGGTYIYMAFAENPFKYSLAR